VEEHFGAEEALVADVHLNHIVVDCLVDKLFELCRLNKLASAVLLFLVELSILFQHILAHVSVLLLDASRNLIRILGWEFLATILQ
jgi:hypothetical protein